MGFLDAVSKKAKEAADGAKKVAKQWIADIKKVNDMAAKLLRDKFDAEKAAKMTQQIIDARKK